MGHLVIVLVFAVLTYAISGCFNITSLPIFWLGRWEVGEGGYGVAQDLFGPDLCSSREGEFLSWHWCPLSGALMQPRGHTQVPREIIVKSYVNSSKEVCMLSISPVNKRDKALPHTLTLKGHKQTNRQTWNTFINDMITHWCLSIKTHNRFDHKLISVY